MLITLYGINNIGKTTQAKRLVERLRAEGYEAEYVKYPVYDLEPTGPYLDAVLRGKALPEGAVPVGKEEDLQLWFTLNRYQFEGQLKTWLKEGKIVIAEDYIGTGLAWGVVKGAELKWLETLNAHLVKEDVAFLIDGERFIAAQEKGHLHEANDAFMERSREVHLELAERYGWEIVPLVQGIDAMAEKLWQRVSLFLH